MNYDVKIFTGVFGCNFSPFRFRVCPWFKRFWLLGTLLSITVIGVSVGFLTGAPVLYIYGQIALGLSVFVSFGILSDRPLINPVQALVALFYFWFGLAPSMVTTFKYLIGEPDGALKFEIAGMESLLIVAIGLPLYALTARWTLKWFEKCKVKARFLMPLGENYKFRTIFYLFAISFGSGLLLIVLNQLGLQGQEQTTYLGGTRTTIWWVGIIDNLQAISLFTNSALMVALCYPWKTMSWKIKLMALLVIGQTLVGAATAGWKGKFVILGLYAAVAWISRKQKVPWLAIVLGFVIYLVAVEPFVWYGRYLSEIGGITTTEERAYIFKDLIKSGYFMEARSGSDINVESLFRGIYPLAGDIVRNTSVFSGELDGYTIVWGLEVIIPKVLYPEKRDTNIGNFFYLHNYSRAHDEIVVSDISNVGPSLPFEIVDNFGWIAGLIWFVVFGGVWTVINGWLLTPERLHNHPLTPMMVGFAIGMEAPLGHWLASLRDLILPLIVICVISVVMKKRL